MKILSKNIFPMCLIIVVFVAISSQYIFIENIPGFYGFFELNVFVPFLILILSPLILVRKHRINTMHLIKSNCLPAGLLISCVNCTVLLNDMDDYIKFYTDIQYVFAPILLSLIGYFFFSFFESMHRAPVFSKLDLTILLSLKVILVHIYFYYAAYTLNDSLGMFYSPIAGIIIFCIIFTTINHPSFNSKNTFEKIYIGSVFSCIFAAASGVFVYSSMVASGIQGFNLNLLGEMMSIPVLSFVYGFGCAYCSSGLELKKSNSMHLDNKSSVYLLESWVFFILLSIPPMTLIELVDYISDKEIAEDISD